MISRRDFLGASTAAAGAAAAACLPPTSRAAQTGLNNPSGVRSLKEPTADCTSHFTHPQFSGLWADAAWHRRITDIIRGR
jgi:hypothetical protein